MAAKKRILLIGETALLEEYASLCDRHGFAVSVRMNRKEPAASFPRGTRRVKQLPKMCHAAMELTNVDLAQKRTNLVELDKSLPKKIPIMSSSVTVTAGEQSMWISRPERLVGVGALPSLTAGDLMELAPAPTTDQKTIERTMEFAKSLGKETAVVEDSIGMVLPRIVCSIANEACFAMAEGVAPGKGIDLAMKFGTNYPQGPVEWACRIGPQQVQAVIDALNRFFGEERYRPAPLLRIAALRNSFSGLI